MARSIAQCVRYLKKTESHSIKQKASSDLFGTRFLVNRVWAVLGEWVVQEVQELLAVRVAQVLQAVQEVQAHQGVHPIHLQTNHAI